MNHKKWGHSVTGGLKMGVSVAALARHIFLGSDPPGFYLFDANQSCDDPDTQTLVFFSLTI